MKPAFRVSRSIITINPKPFIFLTSPFLTIQTFRSQSPTSNFCTSMASSDFSSAPSLEKQFGEFRTHLEESGTLRDRIRTVVSEIESTTRIMYASILLVHHSRPTPGTKSKTLMSPFLFYFYPFLGRF
jgi:hypothetical protein